MRAINITNDKKRDARIGFAPHAKTSTIKMVLPDGRERRNVQFVKTTVDIDRLLRQYKDLDAAGRALAEGDPEIDREQCGRFIGGTRKLYLGSKGEIAYRVNMVQITHDANGSEKERRELTKLAANTATEIPLLWTGREYSREEALRKFVFTRNYQLRHTSGLSYDFLFDMAKQLHTRSTMVFIGGGKKGNEPVVLSLGGTPYRGFLEGRIDGDKYCLILHLTNIELRSV
jgi:hypothetical protein